MIRYSALVFQSAESRRQISMATRISILHFNDCYNIEPHASEPVAGAARFKTALKTFASEDPVVLFSGDIMAPSIITTFTNGQHMIPVLNQCGVECACFGNHEFEFGVNHLYEFTQATHFPWLLSNVKDIRTMRPLADGKQHHIIERKDKKIGLIGLVENEWLSTLPACCDLESIDYRNFVQEGEKWAKYLRTEQRVDMVIALTHMRWPNDRKLAQMVPEIDLILGGHDHDYGVEQIDGRFIIKSGCDFMNFSKIDLTFHNDCPNSRPEVSVQQVQVTSRFEEDPELKQVLQQYIQVMESKMDNVLAEFACDLDCRFSVIRTQETVWGNLVNDILCAATGADLSITNSGSYRSDRIHPASSHFLYRDFVAILPKVSPLKLLSITGSQLHDALENGVSQYPKLEGRFPQVSGVSFAFDPDREPFDRIDWHDIRVRGQQIDLSREYKLITKAFLSEGRDGYTVLKSCPVLADEDQCPNLFSSIFDYFEKMKGKVLDPRIEGRIINLRDKKSC